MELVPSSLISAESVKIVLCFNINSWKEDNIFSTAIFPSFTSLVSLINAVSRYLEDLWSGVNPKVKIRSAISSIFRKRSLYNSSNFRCNSKNLSPFTVSSYGDLENYFWSIFAQNVQVRAFNGGRYFRALRENYLPRMVTNREANKGTNGLG